MADNTSLTGLSANEAQEFHKLYVLSFIGFTLIACVAHYLVWSWRPWIPGPEGYASLVNDVQTALVTATTFFA